MIKMLLGKASQIAANRRTLATEIGYGNVTEAIEFWLNL
jgi:hypothetical protein